MKHSLPLRLSVWICSILFIFFIAGAGVLVWLWVYASSRTLDAYGRTAAREIAYDLDRLFVQVDMATDLVASSLEERDIPAGEMADFLRNATMTIRNQCPDVVSVSVVYNDASPGKEKKYNAWLGVTENGKYRCERWLDGKNDYYLQEWFLVPVLLGRPLWTVAYPSRLLHGRMILSYSVPFFRGRGENREAAGVVVTDLPVSIFDGYLRRLPSEGNISLPESSETFLMNQFGSITAFPGRPDQLSGTLFSLCDRPDTPDPADRAAARSVFRNFNGTAHFRTAEILDGPSTVFYASCVNGWVVGIAIPSEWIARAVSPLAFRILLAAAGALLVIVCVIFAVCRKLNRPLLLLSRAAESVGNGDFSAPLPEYSGDDEIGSVAASFRRMQSELAGYIEKLKQTVALRERAEGELNAAKAIQRDLLPKSLPPYPEMPGVRAEALLIPAHGVGGDLYDVFPSGAGNLALIVGDVSGKGVPAALFMAVTQTLQRRIAAKRAEPDFLLKTLNDILAANNESNMFVTCWAGFLNPETGILSFANAGHNPPLLRRADGTAEWLRQRSGPPLAAFPGMEYAAFSVALRPGDTLVLYTDGVTEAFNSAGEMFGDARLCKIVRTSAPSGVTSEILTAVETFASGAEQSDDITLLAAQFIGPARVLELPAETEKLDDLQSFLSGDSSASRFSPSEKMRLELCAEEIFTNIVKHAYAGKGGVCRVTARGDAEKKLFLVSFADAGPRFNPLEHADPDVTLNPCERPVGGLGIYLVRKNSAFTAYEYADGWNIFTIGFPLPDSCGGPSAVS